MNEDAAPPQDPIPKAFALHRGGRQSDAEKLYVSALDREPGRYEALYGLGLLRLQQERFAESVDLTRRALLSRPQSAEAYGNLGTALMRLGRPQEAVQCFSRTIALAPGLAQAHRDLASALGTLGRYEEALQQAEEALALSPSAEAHAVAGAALLPLSRFDEALDHAERLVALSPQNLGMYSLLGVVLRSLNRPREAIAVYDRALAIKPDHAEAHWNQSLARLAMGDFETGWKQFEWRWRNPALGGERRRYAAPLWLGEASLAGRTLLLHAEQGFGDTVQFARYVPLAAARAARVVLEVPAPLASLLVGLAPNATVIAEGDPLPAFDLHCPFMSLPLAFATRLDTIPADVPYLSAPRDKTEIWRRRLAPLRGLRVGLVWAGAPRQFQATANAVDRRRSISLGHFARLAAIPGVSFVSLQKGDAARQARRPPDGLLLYDWTEALDDFSDTAALIAALDLVISVDTAVVHVAGALAKPVWMLNRFDSCWRWLLGRDDSPWYPTLRQFRQRRPGDWDSALDAVALGLTSILRHVNPIEADGGQPLASLDAMLGNGAEP